MSVLFAAVHESVCGTTETILLTGQRVAHRGRADSTVTTDFGPFMSVAL
jgi:hypothetical protein